MWTRPVRARGRLLPKKRSYQRRIKKVFCPEHRSKMTFQEGVNEDTIKYYSRVKENTNFRTLLDYFHEGNFNRNTNRNQVFKG